MRVGDTYFHSYLLIFQGMLEAMTVTTVSNLRTPHFNDLPLDIQIRIFEQLSTRERAQVAAVCRTWCQVSNANWTFVRLWGEGTKEMQAILDWLQTISEQSSGNLRSVAMWMDRKLGDLITLRLSK